MYLPPKGSEVKVWRGRTKKVSSTLITELVSNLLKSLVLFNQKEKFDFFNFVSPQKSLNQPESKVLGKDRRNLTAGRHHSRVGEKFASVTSGSSAKTKCLSFCFYILITKSEIHPAVKVQFRVLIKNTTSRFLRTSGKQSVTFLTGVTLPDTCRTAGCQTAAFPWRQWWLAQ